MSAIFSNWFVDQAAKTLLNRDSSSQFDYVLHFYVNNFTPDANTSLGSFTDCSIPGYAPVDISGITWIGGAANGIATYGIPLVTVTFAPYAGPQQTLYGYYLTNYGPTQWWWTEPLITPYPVPLAGGSQAVLLNWTDRKLP